MFAAASMYLCMMLAGWGGGEEAMKMEDGAAWTRCRGSVWVKMVSVWVTAGLHAWTLVAPAEFPDRKDGRRHVRRTTSGECLTTPLVVTTPP